MSMQNEKMKEKDIKGLSVKKKEDFSKWYSEIVQKAELADLRYNVKGFLVFQPWSVKVMEKIYAALESVLQKKGHQPYFFPTVIPESNLRKESSHVKGFTPEVFWVTQGGNDVFEERLALRPTSETAFYQMFSLWIRSYKDLPFKTYQRANVFRYETKATRPFLRSREFHWIETHCAHLTEKDAMLQVEEDMQTTRELLYEQLGLPFIFFQRPAWDKFHGAHRTFAADVLHPDGRVVQQPSTHLLQQSFSKVFNVMYKDKDGKDKYVWITCYGPAVSRIFASMVIVHGDDKGLRFPWAFAPLQTVIVPIGNEKSVLKRADSLAERIASHASVLVDKSDKSSGEKFNHWEMKGVPLRIDLGMQEIAKKKITVFRRDLDKKEVISENELLRYVNKVSRESGKNLLKQAEKAFGNRINDARSIAQMKKIIESGGIARCGFCSVEKEGVKCAEVVEKETGARVRGTKFEKEKAKGKCAVCGREAHHEVYVAREY